MPLSDLSDLRAPIAVGALLRLAVWADARPLWLDEAISALAATSAHPWQAIATTDLHPPLGVALIWLASSISHDERVLRLPSLLASVAAIPLLARAAGDWVDPRARLAAAWLMALCAPAILYAGEARPYALGLMGVTAVLASGRASPRARGLAASVALGALWGAWPVVAAVAWHRRDRTIAFVLAAGAALAAPLLLAQHAHQGAGLAHGFLAPWFPPAEVWRWPWFFLRGAVELLGWDATATHSRRALVAGAALALLLVRKPPPALRPLTIPVVGAFLTLAAAGAYPWGGTRHLIVLLPLVLLLLTSTPRAAGLVFSLGIGLLAAGGPTLPHESVPDVLADLPRSLPLVADASAAPAARWYGALLPAQPWSADPVAAACAAGTGRLLVAGEDRIDAANSVPGVITLVRRPGAAVVDVSQACAPR